MIKSLTCKNKTTQDSVGCSSTVLYKSYHRSPRQQEKTPAGKTILLNTGNRAKDAQVFNKKMEVGNGENKCRSNSGNRISSHFVV